MRYSGYLRDDEALCTSIDFTGFQNPSETVVRLITGADVEVGARESRVQATLPGILQDYRPLSTSFEVCGR